ncbi:hypothetical protein QQ056_02020 [Oscillatoria laete-virens NRMC-F 0139]|nr:hypothetical protein [Oscillatoria laete-virens]MDL5052345.1 hypothetical protein [Oscillatoria laete-virens NRMC-F 0139]
MFIILAYITFTLAACNLLAERNRSKRHPATIADPTGEARR